MQFMEAIAQGTPLLEISKLLIFSGFESGKWNPDFNDASFRAYYIYFNGFM